MPELFVLGAVVKQTFLPSLKPHCPHQVIEQSGAASARADWQALLAVIVGTVLARTAAGIRLGVVICMARAVRQH